MSPVTFQSVVKQIHESFQDALANQPAYGQILPFFEALFEAQEAAVAATQEPTPAIDAGRLQLTLEEKMPLVDRQTLTFDQPAAMRLLKIICETAQMANPKLTNAAKVIIRFTIHDEAVIQDGLREFMADDSEGMQRLSRKLDVDHDALAFFFYHSIWPSLARHTRDLSSQHPVDDHWKAGTCPICGSAPALSFLSESGQRFLICGFCRHPWSIDRIFCPSCQNRNAETMGYFFCDQEKAYRVNTCDQCKGYIKTVDTRQLGRYFYAPLEGIVTSHLDIQAQDSGYRGGGMAGLYH